LAPVAFSALPGLLSFASGGRPAMKVTIKSFDVEMEVKNAGIEFEVYSPDGKEHLGDLILTKRHLIWCRGRTRRENGEEISWQKFIDWASGG
jgi:hypothetical protein